jgi:hypothetical protein
MSGRGRGRGNSGRGRSNGNTSGRSNSSTSNSSGSGKHNCKLSKKTLSDYIYYLGSAKQAADYETTMDFIKSHIIKTFTFGNDIATVLDTLEAYNMEQHRPTLEQEDKITLLTDDEREVLNKQHKMEFRAEYNAFMKCKQYYESNTTKAYALIWEQCAKGMKEKIKANENFTSKVKGNPIKLSIIIKQNCLNYQEH